MKTLLFTCLSVALLLSDCRSGDVVKSASNSSLIGRWSLADPGASYAVTLDINQQQGQLAGFDSFKLTGRSSVNTYFADANFSQGPSIESGEAGTGGIGNLGATQIAGPAAATRYEDTYFARLRSVNRAEVTSTGQLRLSYTASPAGSLLYNRIY